MDKQKEQIIYWARRLNERGLVSARSGNISLKVDEGILITSHDCYLGELSYEDILMVDSKGNVLEGKGEATSEKGLHLGIHRKFPHVKVVLHSHSPYTVAFFHYFGRLDIFSFEAKFYLGEIKVVPQETPTVTHIAPVLEALADSNIVVLGQHGVVSIGQDFKEAFSLIELLEEQAKINLILKSQSRTALAADRELPQEPGSLKKYKLLSPAHIAKLAELVNNDSQAQELGRKYDLTCRLAVKDQDSGRVACFHYRAGRIVKVSEEAEGADFLIIGRADILKKVFNRKLDAFVASTQGKVKTKGDFTKMSRWYPVLVRTFKLWEQAPVE